MLQDVFNRDKMVEEKIAQIMLGSSVLWQK